MEGRSSQIDVDAINLGGTLVWNGRLIVSAYSYYDADGSKSGSAAIHFATLSSKPLLDHGDFSIV